jgi:thymidylate synthase (FAD)
LSFYTEWYWQIESQDLFPFLELRLNAHAQKEIWLYAEVMLDVTKKVAPLCCAAFERHILEGVTFSKEEFAEIQNRLGIGEVAGLTDKDPERFEKKRGRGNRRKCPLPITGLQPTTPNPAIVKPTICGKVPLLG